MEYENLTFEETCAACPEQYDVYKDGSLVAYVRLRWGYLSCEVPYVSGDEVYSHSFADGMKGVMNSQERQEQLTACAKAINEYLENNSNDD